MPIVIDLGRRVKLGPELRGKLQGIKKIMSLAKLLDRNP